MGFVTKKFTKINFTSLILIFSLIFLTPFSTSGTSHGIIGKVLDSFDGTKANGANVTMYIESRPDEKLYDIVGPNGNSGQNNYYFVDIGNFPTPWQPGETLIIEIYKDFFHQVNTSINLTNAGFDLVPTLRLPGEHPGGNHPPRIIAYWPNQTNLQIHEGLDFWIKAIDPDNDELIVNWYVERERGEIKMKKTKTNLSEINSSFYFSEGLGNYKVIAVVSDGLANVSMEWQVEVINNPPEIIDYLPTQASIETNTSINFWIKARDIDNDALVLQWLVNNEVVREKQEVGQIEDSFEFSSNVGNYIIEARVSDGIDSASKIWNVRLFETTCIDYWQCSEWSNCSEDGYKQRECWKINPECENNANKPETLMFDPLCFDLGCVPNFSCGNWTECKATYSLEEVFRKGPPYYVKGKKFLECPDIANCTELSRIYVKNCSLFVPIEIEKREECAVSFILIKDLRTNKTLAKIKKPIGFTGVDIYIAPREGKQYCWYCFNGKKDYDEIATDCGGPNCPPCSLKQFLPEKKPNLLKWLLLFLLILDIILYAIAKIKEVRENVSPIVIFERIIEEK